jgi:dihydrofolate reductase / thymidylate synthase
MMSSSSHFPAISDLIMSTFKLAIAATRDGGIGARGTLPWRLPGDLRRFRESTTGGVVIMGRRTWESLPPAHRPLADRVNIVVSSSASAADAAAAAVYAGALVVSSLQSALAAAATKLADRSGGVWIIGGSRLFDEALQSPLCEEVHLTQVLAQSTTGGDGSRAADGAVFCDTHVHGLVQLETDFNLLNASAVHTDGEAGGAPVAFQYLVYGRRHPEEQYLRICRRLLSIGQARNDRTGVGTVAVFGERLVFDLQHSFPLLTTKRVFWRGVVEELFWFIHGRTDARQLADKGVHIWDGNTTREFLDKRGLTDLREGDIGAGYGFQWRFFGCEYRGCDFDYSSLPASERGVDQLERVVETIRTNPTDRRLVVSAWNARDLDRMALPPCHVLFQFYVDVAEGRLSCQMYQRSCDVGLGLPFNIASYGLLTCLVARATGYTPGELTIVLGDTHLYRNHLDAIQEQVQRTPRPLPKVRVTAPVNTSLFEMKPKHVELVEYSPHGAIRMEMAA